MPNAGREAAGAPPGRGCEGPGSLSVLLLVERGVPAAMWALQQEEGACQRGQAHSGAVPEAGST